MGLDTSHGCWSGAYGAFNRWRNELAKVAGYEITNIYDQSSDSPLIDWGSVLPHHVAGHWDSIPCRLDGTPDPLLLIIAHSDCDGILPAQFCDAIADRLTELLPLLPTEPDKGHIGVWQQKTQTFIDGLRLAAKAGEDVEFL